MVEQAERLLFRVAHEEQAADFREIEDILSDEIDKLEALAAGDGSLTGVPAGFRDLDHITGGFQPGNLIVLAGDGRRWEKSQLVCNIAENVALERQEARGAVLAGDVGDGAGPPLHRLAGADLAGDRLRKGRVAKEDWPKVVKACNELESAPLWIDDSSDLGMLELRAKARRLHAQEKSRGNDGLGLVIVDYLQLMRADDPRANRVEQVAQFSRGLKILARELDVPVIGISQLSRAPEQRPDKRPILSDLRESGSIEQDADLVGFLYRDEYYNKDESDEPGVAELIIAKHRNGPIGTVKLAFLSHVPEVRRPRGRGPPAGRAGRRRGAAARGLRHGRRRRGNGRGRTGRRFR